MIQSTALYGPEHCSGSPKALLLESESIASGV